MSATSLGLGGNPVKFLGAYVYHVNSNLGLAQNPGTTSVALVEDKNVTPNVLFQPPSLGSYVELQVGPKFNFCGVITKYEQDILNPTSKTIKVDISDPREIMRSIPIILAPGFRGVVDGVENTECSLIDAFGAFDDFEAGGTGFNLSGWNQAGMEYSSIILALSGGTKVIGSVIFNVVAQVAKAFGEKYLFDLSELTPLINVDQRINTNLINMSDFIQELASKNGFDWFTECEQRTDGVIIVTIKPISRRTDNTDLSIDDFLAGLSGVRATSIKRGFELRNEVACSVLLGAPVESLRKVNIEGMANNPVDLSDEGGNERYYMSEEEMRVVLGTKVGWESWVERNGGLIRYGVPDIDVIPLFSTQVGTSIDNQHGKNQLRLPTENSIHEKRRGAIYEKLKGNAEASYGKRFLFTQVFEVDYIDAVWTLDVIAGNNDANEYFRNNQGKTPAYVEFIQTNDIAVNPPGAIGSTFVVGKGPDAAQPLTLAQANNFDTDDFLVELDKKDYIIRGSSLYVKATIEEGNIVRIDAPAILANNDIFEFETQIKALKDQTAQTTADGTSTTDADRQQRQHDALFGTVGALVEGHAIAYQPKFVYIPTRDKFSRYGPIFSTNITPTSQGQLEIIQDDGFAPWEFGGFQLMLDAMQFSVDNQSSDVKTVETADITIENFPDRTIGESIGLNSNINSISISMNNGVSTSYRLQSFQRRFGELSKQELALLSIYARRSGARTFPQDSVGFIERFRTRIQSQLGGRGASTTSANTGGAGSFE